MSAFRCYNETQSICIWSEDEASARARCVEEYNFSPNVVVLMPPGSYDPQYVM